MPNVVMAVFIEKPTPFMAEFWDKLAALDYSKANVDLLIHSNVAFHESQAAEFAAFWSKAGVSGYHSVELISHKEDVKEAVARSRAVAKCAAVKCDYLFVVDSEVQLDNPHTLKLLIEQNRLKVHHRTSRNPSPSCLSITFFWLFHFGLPDSQRQLCLPPPFPRC